MAYRSFYETIDHDNVVLLFEAQPGDLEFWIHTNGNGILYIGGPDGIEAEVGPFVRVKSDSIDTAPRFDLRPGDKIYGQRTATTSNDTFRILIRSA